MNSNLLDSTSQIKGFIGHFGLAEWWLKSFTDDEKKYIVNRFRKYHPRSGPNSLLEGDVFIITSSTRPSTVSWYLNFLTSMFQKPGENSIARKINQKSLETASLLDETDSALRWAIILNYKARNSIPDALEIAIDSCRRQIELAPVIAEIHKTRFPSVPLGKHEGYSKLVKILEKRYDFKEVIRLSSNAKAEGWEGDWDLRIERCQRKLQINN